MMADAAEDLYQDIILARSRAPRHCVALEPYDAEARGDNPMCGDCCTVRIARDGTGKLARVGFQARGCAISLASADLMAEAVQGLSDDAARSLGRAVEQLARSGAAAPDLGDLQALAGVANYPSRIKCALLPWTALEAALSGKRETTSE